jgi:hypothetical protein
LAVLVQVRGVCRRVMEVCVCVCVCVCVVVAWVKGQSVGGPMDRVVVAAEEE